MKKNPGPEQYWHIGPVYVKKNFLLVLIAIGSILVITKLGFPIKQLKEMISGTASNLFEEEIQDRSDQEEVKALPENAVQEIEFLQESLDQ